MKDLRTQWQSLSLLTKVVIVFLLLVALASGLGIILLIILFVVYRFKKRKEPDDIKRLRINALLIIVGMYVIGGVIILVLHLIGVASYDTIENREVAQEKKPLQSNTEGQKTTDTPQNTENQAVIQENRNTEPIADTTQDTQNEPQTNEPVKNDYP